MTEVHYNLAKKPRESVHRYPLYPESGHWMSANAARYKGGSRGLYRATLHATGTHSRVQTGEVNLFEAKILGVRCDVPRSQAAKARPDEMSRKSFFFCELYKEFH